MNRRDCRIVPTALAVAVIAACGGNGSGGGMVRSNPPPPQPIATGSCPAPITADCMVSIDASDNELMLGGRESSHAIFKSGPGLLNLEDGTYRFDGGARLQEGTMNVLPDAVMDADVVVGSNAQLGVDGRVEGNVDNHGYVSINTLATVHGSFVNRSMSSTSLAGTVEGAFRNAGALYVGVSYDTTAPTPSRITGNFTQTADGMLVSYVGAIAGGLLQIGGTAQLDGELVLGGLLDFDYTPILVPTPYAHHVLHADGGVSGEFAEWSASGLFLTGDVRYLANDVWFDIATISAASAMQSANAGDALVFASAARFDQALAATTGDARTLAQRQFLRSIATVQRIGDYAQAARTFDSLSGHGHLAAIDAQMTHALRAAPRIATRTDAVARTGAGAWTSNPAFAAVGDANFNEGQTFGYDVRLSNGWLLGSSFASNNGTVDVDRSGGVAHTRSPQYDLYLHRDNGSTYTTAIVGYRHDAMQLDRPIDLGVALANAHSEREYDTRYAYVESGRDIALGNGRFTPFVAAHYTQSRGEAFAEYGQTGFELAGGPSLHERTGADLGVRYAQAWTFGADAWLQLDVAARRQHLFDASDAMSVAFVGAPGVVFDLAGLPQERDLDVWQLNLAGGTGRRWSWVMQYEDGDAPPALWLGMAVGL